jgi:hypothetical protein
MFAGLADNAGQDRSLPNPLRRIHTERNAFDPHKQAAATERDEKTNRVVHSQKFAHLSSFNNVVGFVLHVAVVDCSLAFD